MGKILVTGFEPFGGERNNPTERLAKAFDGREIGGFEVVGRIFPVSYRRVGKRLSETLAAVKPDAVIATGLWGGRTDVTVERVAVNVMDARIPDNDGFRPKDAAVVKGGPAAYFSTIPCDRILVDLRKAGVPATLSYSAGTFICNALLYLLLDQAGKRSAPMLAGFLHVPNDPLSVTTGAGSYGMSKPSMSFDTLERAVSIAVKDTAVAVKAGP